MIRNINVFFKSLPLLLLLSLSLPANAEIAVIAHPDNKFGSVNVETLAEVYLGKINRLENGVQIVPIDQRDGTDIKVEFYQKVANKTASQLNAYWSRLIFTGKAQPPKALRSDDEIIELISENPSLVGYIDVGSVDESVKVILTLP